MSKLINQLRRHQRGNRLSPAQVLHVFSAKSPRNLNPAVGSTGMATLSSDTGWKPMLCYIALPNGEAMSQIKGSCREIHEPTPATRRPNGA
jgi:hypothetical protein